MLLQQGDVQVAILPETLQTFGLNLFSPLPPCGHIFVCYLVLAGRGATTDNNCARLFLIGFIMNVFIALRHLK